MGKYSKIFGKIRTHFPKNSLCSKVLRIVSLKQTRCRREGKPEGFWRNRFSVIPETVVPVLPVFHLISFLKMISQKRRTESDILGQGVTNRAELYVNRISVLLREKRIVTLGKIHQFDDARGRQAKVYKKLTKIVFE